MDIRFVVTVSIWLRLGVLFLCYSLMCVNNALGQSYFSSILSESRQVAAVQNASNVNARNGDNMTGLMFAGMYRLEPLARALFEAGADLNLINPVNNYTALHYAVSNNSSVNRLVVGEYLIDVFAALNIKNNLGATPLLLAAAIVIAADRSRIIEKLVKNGGDINAQNNDGDTILHVAAHSGDRYFVGDLLSQWGTILDLDVKNKKGFTPKGLAVNLGFYGMSQSVYDMSQMFNDVKRITDANTYDSHGLNGLMLAIMRNDMTALKSMVSSRSVVNSISRDEYGNTPLHIALAYNNEPVITLLLSNGADQTIKNKFGDTPTHYVVRILDPKKRMEIAKAIIAGNPKNIDIPNNNGNTLLHYLVQYNDPGLMKYIIDTYGAQIALRAKNKKFQTPYMMALKLKRKEITDLLFAAERKYTS